MIRLMNRLLCASVVISLYLEFQENPYPTNCGLLSAKGIVQTPPMERVGNCHNVIAELTAGLSGGSAADGGPNNIANRLFQ